MNGYDKPTHGPAPLSSYSSHLNGHGSRSLEPVEHKAKVKSGAKALYEQRKNYTKTSINSLTDTSQYHVEHLTTFLLDRKDGMVTVDDGVRRLRLLEAKGKVWTQEMLLQVEEKAVSLIDQETQNELENFPMASVQHCQAVINACSYDSILALVCRESGQGKPDLHLFQCDHIKANLIQADIESAMIDAKGGKVKKRPEALKMILKSDGLIPPPPAAPAPGPPDSVTQLDVKSRVAAWSAWTNEQQEIVTEDSLRHYSEEGDVLPNMTALYVDRDVQILNHILDDIEFFITKLQKAAEAFNELSRRKKGKKGKRKSPGEGVLTLRSRPPTEEEFVDCLQKFKHAFNLLGKLRTHIQNPSAADLVHFLFTPLRMVVQTSGGDLARSVLVPLLSQEAIDFLHATGTVDERHMWVSLGEGWTKCRLEWPKEQYFPPCPLRFREGWEPPALPPDTLGPLPRDQGLGPLGAALANAEVHRQEEPLMMSGPQTDSIGQPKVFAKSKYDFVARNNTELSVLKDEMVEVLDDRKQWWKVRNSCGAMGYVPNNILENTRAVDINGRGEPIYSHTIQKQSSRTDIGPGKLVVAVPPAPPPLATNRPPTPPLPPPLEPPKQDTKAPSAAATTTALVSRRDSIHSSEAGSVTLRDRQRPPIADRRKSNMEEVQDELIHRLTLGRSAQKRLPVGAGPRGAGPPGAVSISYDSVPEQVRSWLELKGFNTVTINSLGVLTGAQLFSLNKEELKTVCPDDGARVFSQVTVQKAALERGSGSELQEIMRRRQEKLAANTSDSGVESFDEGNAH